MNTCGPNAFPSCNVPDNYWGHKFARTGDAYVGMINFIHVAAVTAEYVQCKLLQPLIAGHQYYVSFYESLATLPNTAYNVSAVDHIGAYFHHPELDTIEYVLTFTP